MKPASLDAFYAALAALVGAPDPAGLRPPGLPPAMGHFNVFNVADLPAMGTAPVTHDRRDYYKISLVCGSGRASYAGRELAVGAHSLWVAPPALALRWQPDAAVRRGHFCLFTPEFLSPVQGRRAWQELPLLQPGAQAVLALAGAEYAALEALFERMGHAIRSGFAYKYDLLRAYLLELLYCGQQLQPDPAGPLPATAAARLAARFADLLERQFPLASPRQQLGLRTAADYADQLAVHVNHLNRVLKALTGHPTTALLATRLAQEAKLLLRQTDWPLADIADGLGFANVAHFGTFFKRQVGQAPGAFRQGGPV